MLSTTKRISHFHHSVYSPVSDQAACKCRQTVKAHTSHNALQQLWNNSRPTYKPTPTSSQSLTVIVHIVQIFGRCSIQRRHIVQTSLYATLAKNLDNMHNYLSIYWRCHPLLNFKSTPCTLESLRKVTKTSIIHFINQSHSLLSYWVTWETNSERNMNNINK